MVSKDKHDRTKQQSALTDAEIDRMNRGVSSSMEDLHEWLQSSGPGDEGRGRIQNLLEVCSELAQIMPQEPFVISSHEDLKGRAYKERRAVAEECHRLVEIINRSLERYKATAWLYRSGYGTHARWQPAYPEGSDAHKECNFALTI